MTTHTLQANHTAPHGARQLPLTPRGRAFHTVDWFTNGAVVLRHHDNPRRMLPGSLAR